MVLTEGKKIREKIGGLSFFQLKLFSSIPSAAIDPPFPTSI
jgi:hypothetical protein